jgi:feruloyl esterase
MRRLLALMALWLSFATPTLGQTAAPPVPLENAAKLAVRIDRCEGLAGDRFQGLKGAATWVTKASYVGATDKRQAYCSVAGYVNPTNNFGMYLPVDNWNGRYLVRGCGGSCGAALVELACGLHVRDGYACLITDMGHSSTSVDNNWVENNLQGLVDFGYRSTHVTTVAGKAIAAAFYAKPPAHSYFFACSTGGRQGLIEAQRFPEDFDGIVAIAPASLAPYGSKQAASITEVDAFNTKPDGSPILPNRKAVLVHRAVVRACDGNDGISDGLIGDPRRCGWRPEDLACTGADVRDCLSPAQVTMLGKMYAWRGAQKGSELNWIGNYIRNAPLPGEDWRPLFDLAVGRGDRATTESMVNPNNPDLRPFKANGGKLILVHGWSDHSVLPPPTIDYYETMTKTMDGPAATRGFARLFMVPGMDHCAGGEGASAIDYLAAITAWVEKGVAPDRLRGVHTLPGAPLDYFGIDLPNLDRSHYAFERDHRAYPGASVPVGRDRSIAPDARPLDLRLAEAVARSEGAAVSAGFPRRSVLNAVLKGMWELFYRSDSDAAAQAGALRAVAAAPLSPVSREAVARMQAELLLN